MTVEALDTPGSSNLLQVAYDDESKTLEVAFTNGEIYVYIHVPKETFDGFKSAGSAGSYFHRHVKNRYAYARK